MEENDLVVIGDLDYEKKDKYELSVSCFDGGSPSLNDTFKVTVNEFGKNEHSTPEPNSTFKGDVDENSKAGTPVVKVLCEDPDVKDANAEGKVKTYSLLDDASGKFTIDPSTGEVKTAGDLDFETKSSYKLLGQCGDAGDPSLTANMTIDITVNDVNEKPVPTDPSQKKIIGENLKP